MGNHSTIFSKKSWQFTDNTETESVESNNTNHEWTQYFFLNIKTELSNLYIEL